MVGVLGMTLAADLEDSGWNGGSTADVGRGVGGPRFGRSEELLGVMGDA